MWEPHTVDGRHPANHLGCIKLVVNNGIFTISTGEVPLPSTVAVIFSNLAVFDDINTNRDT